MTINPLVSICIPAYEYPELLERCLESIVSQSYTSFEVIITDDSSHDKLKEVVEKFKDDRLYYYKNEKPLGSPANWNKSISYSKGELIKIIHHDDWFRDNYCLQKFISKMENENLDFVFSACTNHFSSQNKYYSISNYQFKNLYKKPYSLLFLNGIGAPSTIMFKKNIFSTTKFDEQSKWYVDVIFYTTVVLKKYTIGFLEEPLINIKGDSPTQVTNLTSGLIKVQELIYSLNKFSLFKLNSFLVNFTIIENLKKYKIKDIETINIIGVEKKLKFLFMISKMPINYKIFAIFRRLYLTRSLK